MELNPLNVLKKRKLSYIPAHFKKIKIADKDFFSNPFEDWVNFNLSGRYSICEIPSNLEGRLTLSTYIAFEDQKELTYFILACPFLRR